MVSEVKGGCRGAEKGMMGNWRRSSANFTGTRLVHNGFISTNRAGSFGVVKIARPCADAGLNQYRAGANSPNDGSGPATTDFSQRG